MIRSKKDLKIATIQMLYQVYLKEIHCLHAISNVFLLLAAISGFSNSAFWSFVFIFKEKETLCLISAAFLDEGTFPREKTFK